MQTRINIKHHRRLKASGIMEVMVAMLLISIIMVSSSVIYNRLMNGTNSMLKLKAQLAADEVYRTTLREKTFYNEEGVVQELTYRKEVFSMNKDDQDLYVIRILIFTLKGDSLYQRDELHAIAF